MAEYVTDAFELAKINSDWILKHAKELDALLGYNSKEMLVVNQVRALSAIDTMMDSLRELKGNIEEVSLNKSLDSVIAHATVVAKEVNQGKEFGEKDFVKE